jgi:protoporphyrinogen/coproporphyrinogen III oxidase
MSAHVVVAGGGITGLTTAWALRRLPDPPTVTLLEADARLGGKILTTPFAGLPAVDAGPDAFLARVPWAVQLCRELGVDDLVSPASGRAYVWHAGRLHPIPDGLVLGAPAGLGGLARSRLLSWRGKARAAAEPLLPSRAVPPDDLRALVRARFGSEVYDRLVAPLVGSIYAGDPANVSVAGSAPQLAEVAAGSRSLLLGLRRRPPVPPGPVFFAPRAGMGALVDALAAALAADPDVTVRLGTAATPLQRHGSGYETAGEEADAVVLTVPATAAAGLLAEVAPLAAAAAGAVPYAGVALATLAFAEAAVPRPLDGSGYLVPAVAQRHVTAVSWASTKWAHWKRPGQVLLRASVGRAGREHDLQLPDDDLLRVILADLREQLGITADPEAVRLTRWPASFPQYEPGHSGRVDQVVAGLAAAAPGVVLAGAAWRGVGIPACIRQGREAAVAVAARVGGADRPEGWT